MTDYFVMIVLWLLVLFFSSAELYKRTRPLKAFFYCALINLLFCGFSILIWFALERDGIAQVIGALIHAVIAFTLMLALGVVTWVMYRRREAGGQANRKGAMEE